MRCGDGHLLVLPLFQISTISYIHVCTEFKGTADHRLCDQWTSALLQTAINKFYAKHSIKINDGGGVRLVLEFADANLDERCMKVCAEFERPTMIQGVCWPLVAGGRAAIGIDETRWGKTLAFSVTFPFVRTSYMEAPSKS